jgi:hypothetical protein
MHITIALALLPRPDICLTVWRRRCLLTQPWIDHAGYQKIVESFQSSTQSRIASLALQHDLCVAHSSVRIVDGTQIYGPG